MNYWDAVKILTTCFWLNKNFDILPSIYLLNWFRTNIYINCVLARPNITLETPVTTEISYDVKGIYNTNSIYRKCKKDNNLVIRNEFNKIFNRDSSYVEELTKSFIDMQSIVKDTINASSVINNEKTLIKSNTIDLWSNIFNHFSNTISLHHFILAYDFLQDVFNSSSVAIPKQIIFENMSVYDINLLLQEIIEKEIPYQVFEIKLLNDMMAHNINTHILRFSIFNIYNFKIESKISSIYINTLKQNWILDFIKLETAAKNATTDVLKSDFIIQLFNFKTKLNTINVLMKKYNIIDNIFTKLYSKLDIIYTQIINISLILHNLSINDTTKIDMDDIMTLLYTIFNYWSYDITITTDMIDVQELSKNIEKLQIYLINQVQLIVLENLYNNIDLFNNFHILCQLQEVSEEKISNILHHIRLIINTKISNLQIENISIINKICCQWNSIFKISYDDILELKYSIKTLSIDLISYIKEYEDLNIINNINIYNKWNFIVKYNDILVQSIIGKDTLITEIQANLNHINTISYNLSLINKNKWEVQLITNLIDITSYKIFIQNKDNWDIKTILNYFFINQINHNFSFKEISLQSSISLINIFNIMYEYILSLFILDFQCNNDYSNIIYKNINNLSMDMSATVILLYLMYIADFKNITIQSMAHQNIGDLKVNK